MLNLNKTETQFYYHLIALWAVCEGMLGGIIHGLNLPISGLIVGGAAVIIISLIGFYFPKRGAILQATLFVCIFKMMLSPHSPIPAYIAVGFQGLTGEFFFIVLPSVLKTGVRNIFRVCCTVFAAMALTESGVQRIFTLTIIYGKQFWEAVDTFISGITGTEELTRYSYYVAGAYVLLHLLAGIVIGKIAGNIPYNIKKWRHELNISVRDFEQFTYVVPRKPKRRLRNGLLVVWVLLLIIFLQSVLTSGEPLVQEGTILNIIVRSVLIILTWHFIVSPVVTYFLKRWLRKQSERKTTAVHEIRTLIPATQNLFGVCWQASQGKRGMKRLMLFMKLVLVSSIDAQYDA